jgi:hypothetical protein
MNPEIPKSGFFSPKHGGVRDGAKRKKAGNRKTGCPLVWSDVYLKIDDGSASV